MAGATWTELRDAGAFEILGELFPDALSSHAFLEDLGIRPALLLPFAPPVPAASWWRSVCRTVAHGRFGEVTLTRLIEAASAYHPGHEGLRALAAGGRTADVLRVLCLLSAPLDETRLRLGAEQRAIREAAAGSGGRLTVVFHPAARVMDILPQLHSVRPHVVHFAGHGTQDGKLLFEDASGMSEAVSVEALASALGIHSALRCVVLASCWSGLFARALLECAQVVVGSDAELDDGAGPEFAAGFYTGLAASLSVGEAFRSGRAAVALRGYPPDLVRMERRTAEAA
ncbi:CHAT domain-containing protein [Streptomyces sp. NPDC054933]